MGNQILGALVAIALAVVLLLLTPLGRRLLVAKGGHAPSVADALFLGGVFLVASVVLEVIETGRVRLGEGVEALLLALGISAIWYFGSRRWLANATDDHSVQEDR